eukprot:scaffold105619_cov50-Tisochrysis_lutea.AAC.1
MKANDLTALQRFGAMALFPLCLFGAGPGHSWRKRWRELGGPGGHGGHVDVCLPGGGTGRG